MARFLAAIEGKSRSEVTRLGSPSSGVRAQAQGWDLGVKVYGSVDSEGNDCFEVIVTGGSHRSTREEVIAIVRPWGVTFDPFDVFGARDVASLERSPSS